MSGLLDNRRWKVLSSNGEDERTLCEQLGVTPLVARVMRARGIRDLARAYDFLHPSLERDWADPLDIPGMKEAADRIQLALQRGECIAVFGDFDVDGITSTCLLTQSLRSLGGKAYPYIPHRFDEGYGLSRAALTRVIEGCDPDLVVTVDNGIASNNEVAWLLQQGIDVVVTDHHEPGDQVPQGVPVTDPKMVSDCYSRELAGAGVALKLVCELGRRLGQPDLWHDHIDLAALGTISDMMLLQGENRSLVAEGVERIRRSTRPGIVSLAAMSGTELESVCADNLPFSLVPRLNAAGRMGTTDVAFDLLFTNDPAEAARLAQSLEQTNTQRRDTEAALAAEAMALIDASYAGERVIVLAGEGWHEGVKGIVASRVVNKYHVPAIIFTITDGVARGSGRSVGSVDLFHAVEQCSDLLVRFGGHAGAVGVTCEVDKVDAFRERLRQVMEALPEEDFVDKGEVTALVSLSELSLENIASLEMLQPFGQGNKRPLFGVRGVFMNNRGRVGGDGAHLRFTATDGRAQIQAIMFRAPHIEKAYACEALVDLVVNAVNESWQGRTNPKLMVSDIVYRDAAPETGACLCDELDQQERGAEKDARPAPDEDVRARLAALSEDALDDELRRTFIGANDLLPAQRQALARLKEGRSTLCVMATGRGKSLVFHLHAARLAIKEGKASVFVYPLRALVADQAFHLSETFSNLGLGVCVLTGESSPDERSAAMAGLSSGSVDVVLTTPEYLAIHVDDFARTDRVGFVVVDEAHHAGAQGSATRDAYGQLGDVLQALGNPCALAVTATASDAVSRRICRLLDIDERDVVVDQAVRGNLQIVDCREMRDRDTYLSSLVAEGEKTVVYVNSRNQARSLARLLRENVAELGHRIAYYHAGLSRDLRRKVEEAFRDDRLCCIVSTSAFGEGVNLPGIRKVVLYHMPFCASEFNQMSGRAGRDGARSRVYLLFGNRDARINQNILAASAPSKSDLTTLYRTLMTEDRRTAGEPIRLDDEALLQGALFIDGTSQLMQPSIAAGLAVFEELGFLTISGFGDRREIRMKHHPAHADLDVSLRYVEGQLEVSEFEAFRRWALESAPQEMLGRINRPITPGFGQVVGE